MKTKALISCAVNAQLICVVVFAYADCQFSDAVAQIYFTISEDDMPKTLFIFEFEDKDGKVYKQYVKEVGPTLRC